MSAVFDKTKPLRIAVDLIQEAQDEGRVTGRSAGSQVEHWARIGRAIERAPGMTVALQRQAVEQGVLDVEELTDNVRVIAALRGQRGIDDFSEAERDLFDELLVMLEVSPQLERAFAEAAAAGTTAH